MKYELNLDGKIQVFLVVKNIATNITRARVMDLNTKDYYALKKKIGKVEDGLLLVDMKEAF